MNFPFEEKHTDFLSNEFGVSKDVLADMDDDALDDLYNKVCQIEIAESYDAGDNELSDMGEVAVEIVNIMADALGYVQEDDDPDYTKVTAAEAHATALDEYARGDVVRDVEL